MYTSVFLVFNNFFIKCGIYTSNKEILTLSNSSIDKVHYSLELKEFIRAFLGQFVFQTETQLGGALWFLQCLFFSSCLFEVSLFVVARVFSKSRKRDLGLILISLVLLLLGYYCNLNSIWAKGLNRAFSCFWMITFGYFLKRYHIMNNYKRWLSIICFLLLIGLNDFGKISLQSNQYPNLLFLVVCSVLGWFMIYGFSEYLCKSPKIFLEMLQYIGVHAIPVLALHFLSFKLVTLIIMYVKNYPKVYLASFPVIYDYVWCVPYMIVGITIPLLVEKILMRKRLS